MQNIFKQLFSAGVLIGLAGGLAPSAAQAFNMQDLINNQGIINQLSAQGILSPVNFNGGYNRFFHSNNGMPFLTGSAFNGNFNGFNGYNGFSNTDQLRQSIKNVKKLERDGMLSDRQADSIESRLKAQLNWMNNHGTNNGCRNGLLGGLTGSNYGYNNFYGNGYNAANYNPGYGGYGYGSPYYGAGNGGLMNNVRNYLHF